MSKPRAQVKPESLKALVDAIQGQIENLINEPRFYAAYRADLLSEDPRLGDLLSEFGELSSELAFDEEDEERARWRRDHGQPETRPEDAHPPNCDECNGAGFIETVIRRRCTRAICYDQQAAAALEGKPPPEPHDDRNCAVCRAREKMRHR